MQQACHGVLVVKDADACGMRYKAAWYARGTGAVAEETRCVGVGSTRGAGRSLRQPAARAMARAAKPMMRFLSEGSIRGDDRRRWCLSLAYTQRSGKGLGPRGQIRPIGERNVAG